MATTHESNNNNRVAANGADPSGPSKPRNQTETMSSVKPVPVEEEYSQAAAPTVRGSQTAVAVVAADESHHAAASSMAVTPELSIIANEDEDDEPKNTTAAAASAAPERKREHEAIVKSALAAQARGRSPQESLPASSHHVVVESEHSHDSRPPNNKRKLGDNEAAAAAESTPCKKMRRVSSPRSSAGGKGLPKKKTTMLLAQDTDANVLNPIHVFVRQHVEVFAATEDEIHQPAPGRKNPIQLKQIGLRCIHCRDLPPRDRVKRAVCYPSSVGRVYHSISDMKHDHFGRCKGLVGKDREQFEKLKTESRQKKEKKLKSASKNSGCSSSTAQYYHDCALKLGMTDYKGGVFFTTDVPEEANKQESMAQPVAENKTETPSALPAATQHMGLGLTPSVTGGGSGADNILSQLSQLSLPPHLTTGLLYQREMYQQMLNQQIFLAAMASRASEQAILPSTAGAAVADNGAATESAPAPKDPLPKAAVATPASPSVPAADPHPSSSGALLASSSDAEYLNPIHCFVRRNVEIFAANKEDVAAPAPGRKTRITLGQVGLRCIHCAPLPVKDRVKRAFCYPPSVSGIYHAVSNMKFDHFQICKGLPDDRKAEFSQLRSSCKRRGSSAMGKGMANSTAQYYHDSALTMGLVDTEEGIRFKKGIDSAKGEDDMEVDAKREADSHAATAESYSPTFAKDGISALVVAASDPRSCRREESQEGEESKLAVV